MEIRHDREGDVIKITLNDRKQTHGQRVLPDVILSASENISLPEKIDYTDITHPRFDATEPTPK